jgi:sulfate adenylyltransferase large subunit
MYDLLRFSTIGSVDDGKSTLLGRLLCDLDSIFDDQVEAARTASKNGLDLALFTDGLRAEREQGITIDVAYRHFSVSGRRFILADTPGHEQYTKNMVTGSSTADVVVILVDACNGVMPQTRRHAYLAWLLGVRSICVAVNKMDKAGFSNARFEAVRSAFESATQTLCDLSVQFIPVSALTGDNVVSKSQNMPWYAGPTLIEFLSTVPLKHGAADSALRLPVQWVIRAEDGERLYAGQLASGSLKPGAKVVVLPSRRLVEVHSIVAYEKDVDEAVAPMSVALRLAEPVDMGRGHMIADPRCPPTETMHIEATLFWMSDLALRPSHRYSDEAHNAGDRVRGHRNQVRIGHQFV